eukprot:jgi/Psemu1/318134/estExt_fgenesh1_pm.C_500005
MTASDCHKGTFFNNGIIGKHSMALIRNVNNTKCSSGMGIEGDFGSHIDNSDNQEIPKSLHLSMSIPSFLQELTDNPFQVENSSGFTISLWIRPRNAHGYNCKKHNGHDSYLASRRTIFTIGSDTFERNKFSDGSTLCDTSQIDFQLSIIGNDFLEIVYRTSNHLFEPCQRIQFNATSAWETDDGFMFSSKPTHVSISLAHFNQQIFVNGKTMARRREAFDNDLTHWNPTSLLQFFNYPNDNNDESLPWDGQLFEFKIYSNILNTNQVRSALSQGLPPSQPFSHPTVAHIYEDAMDENNTLQEIQMTYSFVDDEIDKLLISLDTPHQPAANVRHYITRFPSRGNLFHVGSERQIESSGNHPVLVRGMDRIVYIPRKDEHSEFQGHAYSSFDFCVTTNNIITSSQCVSATISVVVDPINDPPVASIPPPYHVHEGINEEPQALLLTGTDVDKNDFIQTIQVTTPPKMGYLFLSVSSFRKEDNLYHGTLLSDINNTIAGDEVYVEYQFNKHDDVVIQDESVIDFFRFRVQDSAGSWSAEVEGKVHVLSGISSFSPHGSNHLIAPLAEAGGVTKYMRGVDTSGINRTLGFFLKSLPSNGFILDDEGNKLTENCIIESTQSILDAKDKFTGSVNITYVGSPALCGNNDSLILNDTFQYQVVALGNDKGVVSVSSTEEEHIHVLCPVKVLSINAVDDAVTKVSSFVSPLNHDCSGYLFNFTEESKASCSDTALVFGLHVDNVEKIREPVYIYMTTRGGLLSLKRDHHTDFNPIFDQPVMRSSIRIILAAEQLNDVLSAIHFQSDTIGRDEIRVVLQYGRCDHEAKFLIEHDFSESKFECYKAEKTIHVNVQRNSHGLQLLHYPFPWFSFLVILILGPLFYVKGKIRQTLREVFVDWKEEESPCYLETESSPHI